MRERADQPHSLSDPLDEQDTPIDAAKTGFFQRFCTCVRAGQLPVSWALALGFGGLMAAALISIWVLGLSGTRNTTEALFTNAIDDLLSTIVVDTREQFIPLVDQANRLKRLAETGMFNTKDDDLLNASLRLATSGTPLLNGIGFLRPDYQVFAYSRDGSITVNAKMDDDPIAQQAMLHAKAGLYDAPNWSKPLRQDDQRETLMNLRTSLYKDGEFLGILFQTVPASYLSGRLVSVIGDDNIVPFILIQDQYVLAHPDLKYGSSTEQAQTEYAMPELEGFDDPVLASLTHARREKPDLVNSIPLTDMFIIFRDEGEYLFATRIVDDVGPFTLTVGAYFDTDISNDEISRLIKQFIAGLIIIVSAIIAAIIFGRYSMRPLQELAFAAKLLNAKGPEAVEPLAKSRLAEMNEANLAFNAMVAGVREKQALQDLFGKYVPGKVARQLLAQVSETGSAGEVAPMAGIATILFVDLARFTLISERLGPERTIQLINAYFTLLVALIEEHGGIVTQFQGDAVLATFNIPVEQDDHADQAYQCALRIHETLKITPIEGENLTCRIGLATGPVTAGSVGSPGRLFYTVHGDTVNLASRLEQLNKEFQSQILIDQDTYDHLPVKSRDLLSQFGETNIRGRQGKVALFGHKIE